MIHRRPRTRGVYAALACAAGVAGATVNTARADTRFAQGPYLTGVTTTAAEVRAETYQDVPMALTIAPFGAPEKAFPPVLDAQAHQGPRVLRATGLAPHVRYSYKLRAGDAVAEGEFTTAPDDDSSFRFLVYGDNRSDEAAHRSIVAAMVRAPGAFLVHTGDFVASGSNPEDWQNFFSIEAPLLKVRPIFAAVGNHELVERGGREYLSYFGPPTYNYGKEDISAAALNRTTRWGNARFFFLNAMTDWRAGEARTWLETELAHADNEAGLQWRFVVMHHSFYSAGPHGDNVRMQNAGIPALLRAHHIQLVFAGHDHLYERGLGDGIAYLITGGGGAPLYEVRAPRPSSRKVESVRHFLEMEVSPTRVAVTARRTDGSVIETCGLPAASTDWDCDTAPASTRPSSAVPAGGQSSAAVAAPASKPQCGCSTPGTPVPPFFSAISVALGCLIAARHRRKAPMATRAGRPLPLFRRLFPARRALSSSK